MQCQLSNLVTVPYKPFMQFYEAGYSDEPRFNCYIYDEANNLAITTFNKKDNRCVDDIFVNYTPSSIVGSCSNKKW